MARLKRLKPGTRVTLTLAPEYAGEVVEVLEIPGDDLYMVRLDGQEEHIRYSRAALTPEA